MTTRLDFTAPADLSVGRVRIANYKGVVGDWMATPGEGTQTSLTLDPGYYMAEISPAGVRPQSVIFQVHAGEINTVALPDFAALAATGGGTSFLDVADVAAATQSVYAFDGDAKLGVVDFEQDLVPLPLTLAAHETFSVSFAPTAEKATPANSRILSAGLAIERPDARESWTLFDGPCQVQLTGGRLSMDVDRPVGWAAAGGQRVRLSVAIERVRVERLLLPMYRGGTTININPATQSSFDVSLEVIPGDPRLRALWRALEAGTLEHAEAVRADVLRVKGPKPIEALDAADPWEAMLAGLLYLRFPEIFGRLSRTWAQELRARYPWAADTHIIAARQIASEPGTSPADIVASATRTIALLAAAQVCGSPYFNPANMFFNDLIDSVGAVEGLPPAVRTRAERVRRRWQREMPLQRRAGVSFSWLSRDQQLLKKEGILAPNRNVSGRLRSRDTTIIFQGRIAAGAIAPASPTAWAPKAKSEGESVIQTEKIAKSLSSDTAMLPDCPALRRQPGPDIDSNKGRFGGQAAANGFELTAQFQEQANPNLVAISLSVEAAESASVAIGDVVWFCLHSSFDPQWVKVVFRGRRAMLSVLAAGGFTLGAWLPTQKIELESDLADIESAPRIIRER